MRREMKKRRKNKREMNAGRVKCEMRKIRKTQRNKKKVNAKKRNVKR